MRRNYNNFSSSPWQSFALSILFLLLLPLFPIFLDLLSTNFNVHTITVGDWSLAGSMLVIGIAASLESLFQLIIGLVIGAINSFVYAHISNINDGTGQLKVILILCSIMILWHIIERYRRHIQKKKRFLN